jgi:hypothetical protein
MRRRVESRTLRVWAKWCAAVLFVLLLRVWEHVESGRMERQLKTMRVEADRLTYENGRLQGQIHQWMAPSHLEAVARSEFQMAPVKSSHVIGIQP